MGRIIRSSILALAMVITAWILAGAWKRTHVANETISVTGLAKKDFVSDLIVWNGSFSKKSLSMQEAYASLKKDTEIIKRYLVSKGIKESEIVFSSVNIEKNYRYMRDAGDMQTQIFDGYTLSQTLEIESREVDKIENISRQVTELIDLGVEFYSQSPRYYYTKLAELKIEMIANATKDARQRAEKIAESAGSDLGELRKAVMGIFQITGQNSSEEFTYGGVFNTMDKRKTASVTARLEFGID